MEICSYSQHIIFSEAADTVYIKKHFLIGKKKATVNKIHGDFPIHLVSLKKECFYCLFYYKITNYLLHSLCITQYDN